MLNPDVLSEDPVTMAEAKKMLEDMKKRDTDLNFRANKTADYLGQFSILSHTKSSELFKKIVGLDVPRLKELHIAKIVDLLPETVDDLKLVLQGFTLTVNNENLKKIITVVAEYQPK